MKNIFFALASFFPFTVFGQYYYSDIADTRAMGDKMKTYLAQKVKTVTATGYDARGVKTTDFNEWQEVNAEKIQLKVSTRNGFQVSRQYYQFDDQFRLKEIIDSSGAIKSKTVYTYDPQGNVQRIQTSITDSLNDFTEITEHHYQSNGKGKPEKLWRIINAKDSSEFRFTTDDNGNIIDEHLLRRGVSMDSILYYYDEQNRLTDIVRYNKKARKLLPVIMFEYDDSGRLIQKMTILSTDRPDYLIWRYIFNDKGLKTKEALFNKQKELTGRIDYAYTFEN